MAVFIRSLSDNQHRFSKISVSDDTWSVDRVYELPFPDRDHRIVGYCKGLYCFEYDNRRSILWNPSNNEFKFLPLSQLKPPGCPNPNCGIMDCIFRSTSGIHGFGFDSISEDYKVVSFTANFYDHGIKCYQIKQVEVYSLRDDRWETIDAESDRYSIVDLRATYADGCCYWIAQNKISFPSTVLISLNLNSYEFSVINLPPVGGFTFHEYGYILTEYENSIALIVFTRWALDGDTFKNMFFWIKSDTNAWIREMKLEFCEVEKPIGFCGEFLMFEGFDGRLLVYDLEKETYRKIEGIRDYPHQMQLSPFIKSKVLLSTFGMYRSTEGKLKKRKRKGKSFIKSKISLSMFDMYTSTEGKLKKRKRNGKSKGGEFGKGKGKWKSKKYELEER